ncbi:MAG: DEAD/DEAH box helicase [Planctomycetes bacterium]|nr:DEAD/DEAH box helicase [Planctomycetota bacterium]
MTSSRFKKDADVIFRATNEVGKILEEPERSAGEFWYRVRIGRRIESIPEEDLDELQLESESIQSLSGQGKWGQLDAIRCALAIERIVNTNRSTVYAFQNQRILFQPYQYKPLLKILDSPDRRLLIADEVGLGKTIEAGLILTELSAREPLGSVLIVCPSRLREKWRNELNRKFDQDFEIYDRRGLEQAVARFSERPGRNKLHGIVSMQAIRSESCRESLREGLDGLLNLVIVDEAHHARNEGTSTEKLLRDLCEISDSVVLLTATPVQLDNKDLFTLLSALRPTEFRDSWSFDRILNEHSPVHTACGLACTQDLNNVSNILETLEKVFVKGREALSIDPLAQQLIEELKFKLPNSRADWVDLERRIQDLHPLSSILTRTKKRDVLENAPSREAKTVLCKWTPQEAEAYQRLIDGVSRRGWPYGPMSFSQIQRSRQAASCLPAAYECHIIGKNDDDSAELCDILPSEFGDDFEIDSSKLKPIQSSGWTGPDSKFEKFTSILEEIWKQEAENKVLIFTFFKGTARYLEERLSERGIGVLRIDGDVPSDPRKPESDERGKRLNEFRINPQVKVMVSTEVGSEGLDFQFCHHLVNYDLPWNPMVVEQRIGRIDRFGQKSPVVYVYNLVVEGTVEERILAKLYSRIGVFERSVGQLEAILGETIQLLQREYLKGELDEELAEERVERAINAIERQKKLLDDLEQKASQLFGHEDYVREELQRVRNLGQFVSQTSLLALLRTYFKTKHPTIKIQTENDGIFGIRLTDDLRMDVLDAARKQGITWVDRSKKGILRFATSGEKAFEHNELDLVNSQHPLVRAAISHLQGLMETPISRLAAGIVTLTGSDTSVIKEGVYFLTLCPQKVHGIRNRRLIDIIAIDSSTGDVISDEHGQRMLYLMVEQGKDWFGEAAPPMSEQIWQKILSEQRSRTSSLRIKEKGENAALYVRRRNALLAEQQHQLDVKMKRLKTSQARGKEKAARMFEGQIEKAQSRHREQLQKLESQQTVSVIHEDPIAACVVRIVHAK